MSHRSIQVVKQEKGGARIIGKYGFKHPQKHQYDVEIMYVSYLDQSIDTMLEDGDAALEGGTLEVNLTELSIEK